MKLKITQNGMMRYFFILCFIFLVAFNTKAQKNQNIDSLLKVLPEIKVDSQKVITLNRIAMAYLPTIPKKSQNYAKQAQKLAEEIEYNLGLGKSFQILGESEAQQGHPTQALDYYWKALEVFEKLKVPQELAVTLFEIGEIYQAKNDFEKARKYYFRLQDMSDKLKDDRTLTIHAIENIALTYKLEKNYPRALYYLFQALNANRRFKRIPNINRNLGDIGEVYYLEKEVKRADEYLKNALKMAQETKDTTLISLNLGRLSELALLEQNLGQAEELALESFEFASQLNNKSLIKNTARTLSHIYEEKKDFVKGFEYLSLYLAYKDTLEQEANVRKIEGLQQAYEDKNQQTEELKAEIEERNIWEAYLVIGIFAVGVILLASNTVVWYRGKKTSKKKESLLQDQKLTLEEQSEKLKKAEATLSQKQKDSKENVQYALQAQKVLQSSAAALKDILPEHFLFYQPKNTLSGDFYWVKNYMNKIYIVLGDCTGQGVTAALQTMTVSNLLEHILNQNPDIKPEKVLDILNKYQHDANSYPQNLPLSHRKYMELGVCMIDRTNKILHFAGAKNSLHYFQDNKLYTLKGDTCPIGGGGGTDNQNFTLHEVSLSEETIIYLTSDGFQNQFGGKDGKKFMKRRLKDLMATSAQMDIGKQLENFKTTFKNWHNTKYKQIDDVLILGFRWKV